MNVSSDPQRVEAGEPTAQRHDVGSTRTSTLAHVVPALVVAGIGIAACVGARALGLGTTEAPGPGMWPLIVGVLLAVGGIAAAIRRGERAESETAESTAVELAGADAFHEEAGPAAPGAGTWRVALGLTILALMVILVDSLGYLGSMVVGLVLWLRFVTRESWRVAVGFAVAISVVAHLIFINAFGIRMPKGLLSGLFGVL